MLSQKSCRKAGLFLKSSWYFHFCFNNSTENIPVLNKTPESISYGNVRFQTGKREHIYREILAGQLTLSQAGRSAFFHEMSPRLAPLINLESFLDSNKTIFHYNSKLPSFSSIKADYLLENIDHDIPVYLFLSQRSGKSTQVCRTFFPKGRIDYTLGQPRCTLLCKEKRNLSSGKTEILYNRLSKNL